jgi:glutathione S-transferase
MLKLYGGAFSRAAIVRWYLEELGVPYEFVQLDMKAGEHRQMPFLEINPVGKVPAIVDGDFKLWESGAILLYLAEKYGPKSLSLEERSLINQWIFFGNATMAPEIFSAETRDNALPRHMKMLNQHFEHRSYILGNEFSVADVAIGSLLAYTLMLLKVDLSDYPAVTEYIQRMGERPACKKGMGTPSP